MKQFNLNGRVAVVTGSSRGIGKAIATSMADHGAQVVISSRDQKSCDQVALEINGKHPGAAIAVAASISSKEQLQNLVDTTLQHFGRIDVLVCNAASNPYNGPLSNISDEQFRKIFENNVLSNIWLVNMVAPSMRERQEGSIIVVSSVGGFIGSNSIGAYNISKAADLQLIRNLAVELGPDNIRANAIAPGVIRTKFAEALYKDPALEAALRSSTPLGRIGDPEDVAGAAVFLASSAARHISGQSIVIDGGMMAKGGVQDSKDGEL